MANNAKLRFLFLITALAIAGVAFIRPIPQSEAYHHFADGRTFWGIPNFFNVISNLPFVVIGAAGLFIVGRADKKTRPMYVVLFAGVLLTGLGSAYYHWHPDDDTLVWDRIPMTLVFMSLLSATVSELITQRAGRLLLTPLLLIGVGSVMWWHFTQSQSRGDLRWYGLVQFYPVVIIPLLLWFFYDPRYKPAILSLGWVVIWYVVAKVAEAMDGNIYQTIGVSGHTIKHLAAAVSTVYLVQMFRRKYPSRPKAALKRKTIC
jgi:Ceramidase